MEPVAVDVVMLTKNSMKPCLKECIDSIYKNVPVGNLIVIDGGSTDDTLEVLKRYPRVRFLMDIQGNRATSRQIGIKTVETSWFMFIDSDVILCNNWFSFVKRYLVDSKVGAIWGAALQRKKSDLAKYTAMGKIYGKDELWVAVRAGRLRGLTHDTILRKEALEGIEIPVNLHVLEDHYMRIYIQKKGFKWLSVPKPYCYHYAHGRERPKDWYIYGKAAKNIRFLNLRTILTYLFLGVPKSLWIYLNTRNWEAAKLQYWTYIYIIKGWLDA